MGKAISDRGITRLAPCCSAAWEVDLMLPKDSWYIENDTHRVWGTKS